MQGKKYMLLSILFFMVIFLIFIILDYLNGVIVGFVCEGMLYE